MSSVVRWFGCMMRAWAFIRERRCCAFDDDPRNLLALRAIVERLEYRVVTTSDGVEAIRAFELEVPDLVLCDLSMPGCDGIEVLETIRDHATRGDTPVVVVTAYAHQEHRIRALQAGADDFLEKPLDAALVGARVRSLLRFKHATRRAKRGASRARRTAW
jgi:CheY-like chemotaxis protein